MKHSPQPWTYHPGYGIYDAENRRVASTSYKGKPISQKVDYVELEANGRLLAKAPELADILRKVLAACNALASPENTARLDHVLYREVMQRGAQLLYEIDHED